MKSIPDYFKPFFSEYQGGRLHHAGETYLRYADVEAYVNKRLPQLVEGESLSEISPLALRIILKSPHYDAVHKQLALALLRVSSRGE